MADADLGFGQETSDGVGLITIALQRLALLVLIVGQGQRRTGAGKQRDCSGNGEYEKTVPMWHKDPAIISLGLPEIYATIPSVAILSFPALGPMVIANAVSVPRPWPPMPVTE